LKLIGNKRPGIRTGCIVGRSEPFFFQCSAAIYFQQDDTELQVWKSRAGDREDVQYDTKEMRYRRSDAMTMATLEILQYTFIFNRGDPAASPSYKPLI
jgi:hypothetical protein